MTTSDGRAEVPKIVVHECKPIINPAQSAYPPKRHRARKLDVGVFAAPVSRLAISRDDSYVREGSSARLSALPIVPKFPPTRAVGMIVEDPEPSLRIEKGVFKCFRRAAADATRGRCAAGRGPTPGPAGLW